MNSTKDHFELFCSPGFSQWLASLGTSLAFTTYQAGKVFFVGPGQDSRLSIFERNFSRCMGMGVSADTRSLLLACEYQIHRLDNILPSGSVDAQTRDAIYAPHQTWITGDVDVHDIGFGKDGLPVFVNTLFNCIGSVSEGYSFRPVWKPPFVSAIVAEDRCHLNGMALDQGVPRFVTAAARSDKGRGWRDQTRDGGVVIDVASGEIVLAGLSMPHSPRQHDGRLWLLNSGTGEFGVVDTGSGRFTAIAFVPGFARGMAFVGDHALIGLSLPREDGAFGGLALGAELARRNTPPFCGLVAIDLRTGETRGWIRLEGVVRELYDVVALPAIRRPSAIGFKSDDVKHVISMDV